MSKPDPRWWWLALLAAGCGGNLPSVPLGPAAATPGEAMTLLTALAHDSMEGRRTGEPGASRAAALIASEMARLGLEAGGDSGFYQRVPLAKATRVVNGREISTPGLMASIAARDSLPPARRLPGFNVVGVIRGSDPALAGEHVLVGAHYDHVGIRSNETADSIFNGADDDASGVVAVLGIARQLLAGPPPRRTVVLAAWTGEEVGLLGARWYADHPTLPLAGMVANLEVEMIGRPDSLAGGPGRAWLTGFERSTMGDLLVANRIPISPDRRPTQNFFQRSDNYQFALKGIVAHTVSSYNMHADYHRPTDEVGRVDPIHLSAVIDATARAVRVLTDGPGPVWKPGGQPTPAPRRTP
ncbi:MAG: M20/M25/M40 family metallo-hydrolase [Gemmatimonadales bacterium]